ncbi:MAG: hypothetical protein R3F56_06990 [Planctomycetota bacterium]
MSRSSRSRLFSFLLAGLCAAQEAPPPASPAQPRSAAAEARMADRPLPDATSHLLDLAFGAASALPLDPHIKTRSLAQESVVSACLTLDQPERAGRLAKSIANWRRAACVADLASYLAHHGAGAMARERLREAANLADGTAAVSTNAQEWRRDRVRVKIAGAYLALGDSEQAAKFMDAAVPVEAGKVEATKARLIEADDYAAQVEALDAMVASGDFDQVQNALAACAELYARFYGDEERRGAMRQRVLEAYPKLPLTVRIAVVSKLARTSVEHDGAQAALALVEDVYGLIGKGRWRPEDQVRLSASAAELRYLAGDHERARKDIAAALAMYGEERRGIESFERAGVLRPVAEALQTAGDKAGALAAYRRALDDGAENPNARPRATDLTATCVSMAVRGVEPDEATFARIREILEGLRDPW